MSGPIVSIVTPTWNQLSFIQGHVESIKRHTPQPHQIIVIDNGSRDATTPWLERSLRQQDIIVRNIENRGFAKANNQGLALAEGEYVLFLNNDIEVLEDTWLDKLVEGVKDADLVGPNLCKVFPVEQQKVFLYEGEGTTEDKWHYIEGWCLFGRKEKFLAIDGWCEDFFPTYCDDSDLGFRAKVAGLKMKKVPVPIKHFGNQAFPNYEKFMNTNANDITLKNSRKLYQKWVVDFKGSF